MTTDLPLKLVEGFLPSHTDLFATLDEDVTWEERVKKRPTASYTLQLLWPDLRRKTDASGARAGLRAAGAGRRVHAEQLPAKLLRRRQCAHGLSH